MSKLLKHLSIFALILITFAGCDFFTDPDPSDSIKITYPTAGLEFDSGDYMTIRWSYNGYDDLGASLYKNGSYVKTIDSYIYSYQDTLSWRISSDLETDSTYQICISDEYGYAPSSYSPMFTIKGLSPDIYEDDDNYLLANTITLDSTQKHSIISNDSDWVKIAVQKDSLYTVKTESFFTHYLYLYTRSSGSFSNKGSKNGTNNTLYFLSESDDTLYILARYYSTSYNGNYDLTISAVNKDSLNTFTYPALGDTLNIGSSKSLQWNANTALFGSYVNIDLYSDTTHIMSITSYESNDGVDSWTPPSYLETGSKYRLKMSSYYSTYNFVAYSDYFTIVGITPDQYEDDDTKGTSTLLSVNSTQTHTAAYNDSDWVKIPVTAGSNYLVKTSSSSSYLKLELYEKNSSSYIKQSTGYTNTLSYLCTSSDTLYAMATPTSSSVYNLSYTISASIISEDTSLVFTSPLAGDTLPDGLSTTIRWNILSAFNSYVSFSLYQGNKKLYTIDASESNDGMYTWGVPNNLATADNYKILIEKTDGTAFAYSDTFRIEGIAVDSFENDNSYSEAVEITTNTIQGHSLSFYDEDWMKLAVDSGMIYSINSTGSFSRYLRIYDTSSTEYTYTTYGSSPALAYQATKDDTIHIQIDGYGTSSSNTGSYTIGVTKYHPDSIITITSPTSSSVFNAGSSYQISFNLVSALFSGSYLYIDLYDDTIKQYSIQSYSSITTDSKSFTWTLPSGLETGSKYRIKVRNAADTKFQFSDYFSVSGTLPDAYEDDDDISTARPISDSIESHTLTYLDQDWFSLQGVKDSIYVFDKTPSSSVTIVHYGDSGTVQQFSTSSSKKVWLCNETETYHFKIYTSSTSSSTNYTIGLSSYSTANELLPVTSPAVGDTLISGTSNNAISWSNGTTFSGSVQIFLFKDGAIYSTIDASETNDGYYSWTIPSSTPAGDNYSIRIVSTTYDKIYGVSGAFRIE